MRKKRDAYLIFIDLFYNDDFKCKLYFDSMKAIFVVRFGVCTKKKTQ